jgi:hypothetical protein
MGGGRWHRRAVPGLVVVVVLGVGASACAPQSPDHSSWTDQAHTALGDVSSAVATVSLLLDLEAQGKVPGKYQQVVAQDSESAVGRTMSRFGGEQPVPVDDRRYHQVTSLMSDASDLLADVRIAIVRRDRAEYPKLRDDLASMQDRLSSLEGELEGPGR